MRFWRRDKRSTLARLPMPANGAPGAEWDLWIAAQELDSIVAGWVSSGEQGFDQGDAEFFALAQAALHAPGLRELLGDEWDEWAATVEEHRPS